jgi:hypothetical protein
MWTGPSSALFSSRPSRWSLPLAAVDRVVCAVDCGIAVNPNIVAMQMESGIGFGLAAALSGAIRLKDGVVEQSNFRDYPVLRINQMPQIEVHIVPSTAKSSGVGEPGTPVIAPALANALLALAEKPARAAAVGAERDNRVTEAGWLGAAPVRNDRFGRVRTHGNQKNGH